MAAPRYTMMRQDVSTVNAAHYGDARDAMTILAALTDIGGDQAILLLADDDDGVWTLGLDVTIPPNVVLQIPLGVTVAGTGGLLIEGGLLALRSDWFQSTGVLTWLVGTALFQVNALRAGPAHLGSLVLDTPLPITEGGTGARDAPQARINLGIVPGTDIQPYDPTLAAFAGLNGSQNQMIYFTGPDALALALLTPYARTLLDDANASTMRDTLLLGPLATKSVILTADIFTQAVTYDKIQALTGPKILGRYATTAGSPQEITIGAGLVLDSSGVLGQAGGALSGAGAANRLAIWSGASTQIYHDRVQLTYIEGDTAWPCLNIGTPTGGGHISNITSLGTSGHLGVGGGSQFWGNVGIGIQRDTSYVLKVGGLAYFTHTIGVNAATQANEQVRIAGGRTMVTGGLVVGEPGDASNGGQLLNVWSPTPKPIFLAGNIGIGGNNTLGGGSVEIYSQLYCRSNMGIEALPNSAYGLYLSRMIRASAIHLAGQAGQPTLSVTGDLVMSGGKLAFQWSPARWDMDWNGTAGIAKLRVHDYMAIGMDYAAGNALGIKWNKIGGHGIVLQGVGTDTGGGAMQIFCNAAGAVVGSIYSDATGTSFGTTSDVRLKEAIVPLVDALARVLALRPVSFRWQVDGSPGEGFVAHELQQQMPLAVSGQPNEVNPDGSIKPQQADQSKIIPWLVSAMQELAAQVAALQQALQLA